MWQGRERERRDQGPWIVKGVSNNLASQPNLLGFKEDIFIEQGGDLFPRHTMPSFLLHSLFFFNEGKQKPKFAKRDKSRQQKWVFQIVKKW